MIGRYSLERHFSKNQTDYFGEKKVSLPKPTCRQCFEAGLQQAVGRSEEEEKTCNTLVYHAFVSPPPPSSEHRL